jgi:predicted esterase
VATEIVLKDGRLLSGRLAKTSGMADSAIPSKSGPESPLQTIVFLDDDLRRTFVSQRQVKEVRPPAVGQQIREKFNVRQGMVHSAKMIKSAGPILSSQPFDQFGRRIVTMNTYYGLTPIVQGITEITPEWTRVDGISHSWDMRIATSSIPRDVLGKILMKLINPRQLEDRRKIARFYLQSERYEDAIRELQGILADFPDSETREQIAASLQQLRQLAAERLLSELRRRRESGQHQLVMKILAKFPSEGINGAVLQVVREMTDEYQALQARRKLLIDKIDELLEKIQDQARRNQLKPIRDEIVAELSLSTIDRMAAFYQGLADPQLVPGEKLALAVSGWILGADAATTKLGAAISTYDVRRIVLEYLNEPLKVNRDQLYASLISYESATPPFVAAMLAKMKPPAAVPAANPDKPGYYELSVPGPSTEPPVRYLVQLPPEYDPHRRYPAIVTLQGDLSTAENQIDWWAGAPGQGGSRAGQASRNGYIVIAPQWTLEHQAEYQYSGREHAAVLDSLRDACLRFAIDTDRVFLSGHSMGGDAAWDIGLAHPDLWAGVIPIVARADRYVAFYWENAQLVPFYFVCGELDGNKMVTNARDLDRYLKRGYNTTVVEFEGRGHEEFSDEILRLFDWMGRFRREFFPRQFTCATMRRFDNFFWWIELSGLPSGSVVEPSNWPPPRNTQAMQVKGSITNANGLYVSTGSSSCKVWLAPQIVDFTRRVNIVINGRRLNGQLAEPSLPVLLEDVRARGDRQHPFWAKVETGR